MNLLDCFANVLNASRCTPLSLLLCAIMGISGLCVPLQCPSVFTASFGGMQLRSSRGSLHNRFLTCRGSHSALNLIASILPRRQFATNRPFVFGRPACIYHSQGGRSRPHLPSRRTSPCRAHQ